MFGAEPVIDRDHRGARISGQLGADVVVAVETADNEAAAVEVDGEASDMRRSGQVAPDRYVMTAGEDGDIVDSDALRPWMAQRRAQLVVDLPLTVGRSFPCFIWCDFRAPGDEGKDLRFGGQWSR